MASEHQCTKLLVLREMNLVIPVLLTRGALQRLALPIVSDHVEETEGPYIAYRGEKGPTTLENGLAHYFNYCRFMVILAIR